MMSKSSFKNLIKECIAEVLVESDSPHEKWTDTFGQKMPGEFTVEGSEIQKPEKLSNSERKQIGIAFQKLGLDGNGRFEKKEYGLQAITSALSQLGFQLDMISADIIMGDKGSRNFTFRRSNDEGQDPFTEKPEISNSRIVFTWERMDGPTHQYPNSPSKFEVLAYAS